MKTEIDQSFYQFDLIKAYWKNHKIYTHLMTKKPSLWIDKVAKYSDIIFFHYEVEENLNEIQNKIIKEWIKTGNCFTCC